MMLHTPVLFLVLATALALLPSEPRSQPGTEVGKPYVCDQLCRTLTYWGGYHNPTRYQSARPPVPPTDRRSPYDLYPNCFQQNFFFGPNLVSIPFSESSSDLGQQASDRRVVTCSAGGDGELLSKIDECPRNTEMGVDKPSTTSCPVCSRAKQSYDLPSATLLRKPTIGGSTADPSSHPTSTVQVTTIQPDCLPKKCDVCQTPISPPIRRYSAEIPADSAQTPPTEASAHAPTASPPDVYHANEYSSRIPSYENIRSYIPPVFEHFSDFCALPHEVVFPTNETANIYNGKSSKTTADRPFLVPHSWYRPQPKCIIIIPKYTCRPVREYSCLSPMWSGVGRDNCIAASPELTINRICHPRDGKETAYFTDPDRHKKNGCFENADIYFENVPTRFPAGGNKQRKDSATPKPSYLTPVGIPLTRLLPRTDDVGFNSTYTKTVIAPPLQPVYSLPEPKGSYLTPVADTPYVPKITPNNSISEGNYNPPREKENTYNFPISNPPPGSSPIFTEQVNSSTSDNPKLRVDTTSNRETSNPNPSIEPSAEYRPIFTTIPVNHPMNLTEYKAIPGTNVTFTA